MNKCFYGGQTDEQIYRRMEIWRRLAGWTNRLVDNWVDRWVNRYVDGGEDRYRHVDVIKRNFSSELGLMT